MVLINLHRNLHEKSSFLSEIMFIRINPYLCHLLTRYQSTIFPNHKSCVRKKGVPSRLSLFLEQSQIVEEDQQQHRRADVAQQEDEYAVDAEFQLSVVRNAL